MDAESLANFFDQTKGLVEQSERQYGVANIRYTEYILERFEIAIVTATNVRDYLLEHETGVSVEEYCSSLNELVGCLRKLFYKWEEHQDIQQSHSTVLSYQAPVQSPVAGRPRFVITKDQLSYLLSLSFKCTEIAALLGVSRMTVYR